MRTPMNYLLVNLAVADILYAMFMATNVFVVQFSFIHHPDGVIGQVVCKVVVGGSVAWIGGVSSILTLFAIAIERYYAVMYPHGNKGKLTKRKLKVIIPGVWICSLILNIPHFLALKFDNKSNSCLNIWPEKWMGKANVLAWEIVVVVTMALMIMLYSKVVYTLWFKRNDKNQLTYQQIGVMRVRKRVTLMVVTVTAIFGICWGTDVVVYIIKDATSYNIGSVPVTIANTMVLFNAAVNPFVYALLNQKFRETIKRMICCTGSSASRYHPSRELQDIELANNTIHPAHTAEPSQE
ncbi:hypothetical protein ACROYT_G039007 [Oculina patagonica]